MRKNSRFGVLVHGSRFTVHGFLSTLVALLICVGLCLPTLAQETPTKPPAGGDAAKAGKPLMAVMPFDNHTRLDSAGMDASDLFIKCLFKTQRYSLVHPVEAIKKLMGHNRGCVGVDEIPSAQRIGKSLNSDVVLIGDVRPLQNYVRASDSPAGKNEMLAEVSARLVDVGTGKTLWLSHYTVKSLGSDPVLNRLDVAVAELAAALVQKFPGKP